jgi:hypothetical protein
MIAGDVGIENATRAVTSAIAAFPDTRSKSRT